MAGMKLTAIASVEYMQGSKRKVAEPGKLFTIEDEEQGDKLINLKAARPPSEAELALEAMARQKQAAAAKVKDGGTGKPAAKPDTVV